MSDHLARRVNPRALLSDSAGLPAPKVSHDTFKHLCIAGVAALMGLSAFGAVVVRANDDSGVLAFVRQQTRQAAPVQRAMPVYPVAYYAPRAFFPSTVPRRNVATQSRQWSGNTMVASYAPFGNFIPTDQGFETAPRRKARGAVRSETASVQRLTLPAPRSSATSGGRVTYCVRTCDGFYFPIGSGSGSDRADEATCNSLCPAAPTKIFTGQIGADIDDARGRDNGKRYTTLASAFSYRKSVDKSCSCTGTGFGIATDFSVYRDGSLVVGDIVMTGRGMKVFNGGSYPYREANFTAISRSDRITAATRDSLRSIEQASLPGRSGLSAARPQRDELKDLKTATRSVEKPTTVVRYVGPDRTSVTR